MQEISTFLPHANRGNVAIIAWNTLTAPYVWDVTNTEYEGTINLGNSTRSLLGIYFRDYVHMVEGRYNTTEVIKEAEDLTVAAVPSTDRKLKERQIKLVDEGNEGGWDKFADAFSTNSKEDTYRVAEKTTTNTITEPEHVIATVPEEVYKNLDNLQGKKVTVLFGEDNTVALIIVTNDGVVDGEFVDKYDSDDKEITIAGTKYEFAETTPAAYVNNSKTTFTMTKILDTLGEKDGKDFTKRVKANVLLDDEGDIERLDLYVSGTYEAFNTVEGIVTKVKGEKITYYTHGSDGKLNTKNVYDYSEVKAKNLPVVSKDGEIVSLEDIVVNDVITLCYDKNVKDVLSIYVSSTKLDGEVTRTKNADNSVYVDGTKYVSSMNGVALLTSDDVEDNNTCEIGTDVEKGDTISAFLNIYGEYVLIATDDANDGAWTFAIVRGIKNVDENDDEELVATLKLLMADGSKSNAYKVVADVDDYVIQGQGRNKEADFEDVLEDYIGKLVAFKANADMEIVLDLDGLAEGMLASPSKDFEDFAEEDLVVVAETLNRDIAKNPSLPADFTNDYEVTEANSAVASKDYKTITYTDGKEYVKDFEDTKIFDMDDQEVSEKWNAMVNGDALVGKAVVICEKDKAGIKYIAFKTTDAATSDSIYARLLEVFSDVVSLFDGNEEVEYEHKDMEDTIKSYAKNSFVEYETNSKNEVSKMNLLVDVDEFEDTNYDEIIAAGVLNSGNETKLAIEDKLNNAISVTAKVVAGAYVTDFAEDFGDADASKALGVYTIENIFPVDATDGDVYTVYQKNPALNQAYNSAFSNDVKLKSYTIGDSYGTGTIKAGESLNVLLNNTDKVEIKVYAGTVTDINAGDNELIASYTIKPNITVAANESEKTVAEVAYTYVKDNFKVENIYTNRFEYDTVEDVTLGTIRIDKEDTTIYVMESDGTYTVSKDFSTIEVGSYVIPFKTSECDPQANANILVVID